METEHRDAELVHHVRIDLAIRILVGHLLATPREAHRSTVVSAVIVLQCLAIAAATGELLDTAAEAIARHAAATQISMW